MIKNKFYIYGNQNVQVPAHLNFGKYMIDRLSRLEDKIAIKNAETGEKLTHKELTEYAVKVARALSKLGVTKGDVVALETEPYVMFFPTALGIILNGATYTAFVNKCGKSHLEHAINMSQPKFIICTEKFWTNNETFLKTDCKMIKLEDIFSSLEDIDVESFEPASVQGQTDVAIISYSSGTTGMSKGIQATHLNCLLYCSPEDPSFKEDYLKSAYVDADFTSTYSAFIVYKMLALGKTIVFADNVCPETMLTYFEKEQINVAFLVPSLINLLLNNKFIKVHKIESLQYVYSAAYKIPGKAIEQLKQRIPSIRQVLQGYGLTETHFIASQNYESGTKSNKTDNVGTVCPGVILKITNPENQEVLGPNQHGLISVKGPAVMKGYINLDPSTYLDEEGWFKTGDLGYYDEDKLIHIVGRIKQMIKYHGYTVSPLMLESILLVHPGVREAGVVGKPDPVYGEEPIAFVVRKNDSDVTEQELIDYVAAEVPFYMQIRGVKFIAEIPRSARHKTLYGKLLEMLN